MTRRRIAPWLIMGPDPYLATCKRCGKQEAKPELPCPVDALVRYGEYLSERHRYCKAPEEAPPC